MERSLTTTTPTNDLLLTTGQMTTRMLETLSHNASFLNKTGAGVSSGEDYIGYSLNITDLSIQGSDEAHFRYWALFLLVFPIITIMGNVLVVMSVFREKYLQSCTNYFVVSLAVSDLMVASLVMPFAVYYEITQKWYMSNFICDAWVAMDVMGSTASILNLVSIAIDRYIAVQYPLKYAQHKNSNRIYLTIAFVWILSFLIALPMVSGMNETETRNPNECAFNNGTFLIYSSIFSFYFPTLIMIILYYKIFRKIRSRTKAKNSHNIKLPSVKNVDNKTANKADAEKSFQPTDKNKKKNLDTDESNLSPTKNLINVETNNGQLENEKLLKKASVEKLEGKRDEDKKKLSIIKSTVQKIHNQTPLSAASKKERKVTKTLAIVVIVYLVCWSPFFAINNLTVATCKKMQYECAFITPNVVSTLTWLGYLNSLLNPIILTFNIEFRRAFAKILSDVCGFCH